MKLVLLDENIIATKTTIVNVKCNECGKTYTIEYQSYAKNNTGLCLSCSKKGIRSGMFGKEPANKGKKRERDVVEKAVATRIKNNSYHHSEETRKNFSKNRMGNKNPNFGNKWSGDRKREFSILMAKKFLLGDYDKYKVNTKPEIKFEEILYKNNIQFLHPFLLENKIYDFYIPEKNLLIEIDGIYWHGKDLSFEEMNDTQKKSYINDRVKNKLANKHNFKIIRIWEDEIDENSITIIQNIK